MENQVYGIGDNVTIKPPDKLDQLAGSFISCDFPEVRSTYEELMKNREEYGNQTGTIKSMRYGRNNKPLALRIQMPDSKVILVVGSAVKKA